MIVILSSVLGYIGPGLGGGIITAVLGFFTSIFLALFAIVWYPVKRLIKKIKGKKTNEDGIV
jgi:hypothetical protein